MTVHGEGARVVGAHRSDAACAAWSPWLVSALSAAAQALALAASRPARVSGLARLFVAASVAAPRALARSAQRCRRLSRGGATCASYNVIYLHI